jgi:TonB family protein
MSKTMISELSAIRRSILVLSVSVLAAAEVSDAQRRPSAPPPPAGQDIVAKDGDRIIVEEDARVQIVRRRAAAVRTIFDQAQRILTVLIDYPASAGAMPDGGVDSMMSYFDVEGDWPLGERWEGSTTMQEYTSASGGFGSRFGWTTPAGVVQLFPGPVAGAGSLEPQQHDPAAIAVLTIQGSSAGGGRIPAMTFDQAEQEQLAHAASRMDTSGASTFVTGSGGVGGFSSWSTSSGSPVRGGMNVGGGMRAAAQKIRDVAPVYPNEARSANVRGVVILEITVGVDGSVTNPRVLRSIPLLDEAALAAVRQWQYQPVLLNGTAVPVIMTVAVPVGP